MKENLLLLRDLKSNMTPKSNMTAISKNVYFDVLDDIVNKYNNAVHRTIKMKHIELTDDSYAEYNEDSNKKDPKFNVGDHVMIMSNGKDMIILSWMNKKDIV